MKNMSLRAALLAATLCGCATTHGSITATTRQSPVERLFRAAGDQAAVTVLLDGARYQEVAGLRPLLVLGGKTPGEFDSLLTAPSVWTALGMLLHSSVAWPAAPAGWDPSRPLVLALMEAPETSAGTLAQLMLADAKAPPALPLRHRLLVPARDAALLQQTLRALAAASFPAAPAGEAGIYGIPGGVLAIEAANDHVRVEVAHVAGDSGARWDLRPLLAPPPPAGPARSAAQRFAMSGGETAVVYLRPERLRGVNLVLGSSHVLAALAGVDPEFHYLLATKGWAELAGGDLILSGDSADFADSALALTSAAKGLRLTGVLSLTTTGAARFMAAAKAAQRPRSTYRGPVLLRLTMGLDLTRLIAEAPPPQGVPMGKRSLLLDRIHECGYLCTGYLGLRNPLGTLRAALKGAAEVMDNLPRGSDLIVTEASRQAGTGALAVVLRDSPLNLRLLAQLDTERLRDLRHSTTPLGSGLTLHRLGMGMDPAAVYAAQPEARSADLLSLALSLTRVRPLLGGHEDELRPLFDRYGTMRSRVVLGSGALMGRTVLTRGAAELTLGTEEAPVPLAFDAAPVASSAAAAAPGQACLRQMQELLVQAANGVVAIDPTLRAVVLKHTAAELAEPQRCAAADAQTSAEAQRLAQTLELLRRRLAADTLKP